MVLADALESLGKNAVLGRRYAEVPVAQVVGTLNRPYDFDHEFRLVNTALRDRWTSLATALESGASPPPVELVQLGELYFVSDGHHRVSVARSRGWATIPARVIQICTVAYAMCCLRLAHLPSKAAERQFLERVPLPDPVRRGLWLDCPCDWARLADAAEAWAFRRSLVLGRPVERDALAQTWWTDEVQPVVARLRAEGLGTGRRDVQLYAAALDVRDGAPDWPDDLADRLDDRLAAGRATRLSTSGWPARSPTPR